MPEDRILETLKAFIQNNENQHAQILENQKTIINSLSSIDSDLQEIHSLVDESNTLDTQNNLLIEQIDKKITESHNSQMTLMSGIESLVRISSSELDSIAKDIKRIWGLLKKIFGWIPGIDWSQTKNKIDKFTEEK